MAEFQTVMAQAARVCKSHETCGSCPVGKTRTVNCRKFIFDHPDEFEEIVMKWAAEHPLVTNGAKFWEVFGYDFVQAVYADDWYNAEYKEPEEQEEEA